MLWLKWCQRHEEKEFLGGGVLSLGEKLQMEVFKGDLGEDGLAGSVKCKSLFLPKKHSVNSALFFKAFGVRLEEKMK